MIVEIGKWRKKGFRFDALSVFLLCQQHDVELDQIDSIDKREYISSWVWCAYKSWCMFRYQKPRLSYDAMKKFIARMRKDDWDKILEAIIASRGPEGKVDKKKVLVGATSSSQAVVPG